MVVLDIVCRWDWDAGSGIAYRWDRAYMSG